LRTTKRQGKITVSGWKLFIYFWSRVLLCRLLVGGASGEFGGIKKNITVSMQP
jgi:hypothetical protein